MSSGFFSIIPARIGSKGIPKKNLYPLLKKPLIQWTIEASLKSNYIDKTIVSSDSIEVLNFDSNFEFIRHIRSDELSNDTARSEDVVLNIIENKSFLLDNYEYVVLLQPTSPLRTSLDIDKACKKIIKNGTDSLISVKEISNGVLKTLIENNQGGLMAGFNKDFSFMPRQELPKAYMPNGAIYISKISSFIKNKSFMSENNSFMLMDENSSIDIDTIEDIEQVERLSKNISKLKY